MDSLKPKRNKIIIVGISCFIVICMVTSAVFVLKMLLQDDGTRRKRQIQRVTLVKRPPPPKIKEKPPEPEIKKEEKIVEPEPEEPQDDMEEADEGPEPGDDLGLDADGTGGGDNFGLRAKKGGRALILGDGGGKSLMKRYAWYTRMLQEEIREKINTYLEDKEDIPSGKHRMLLWVKLDKKGNIRLSSIPKSSGNVLVDTAVEKAIAGLRVSEVPPEEMPKKLKVRVTFKS